MDALSPLQSFSFSDIALMQTYALPDPYCLHRGVFDGNEAVHVVTRVCAMFRAYLLQVLAYCK